jgi:mycothiol synthase
VTAAAIGYAESMAIVRRSVVCCPPELRPAALRWLHRSLPADQQSLLAQALESMAPGDSTAWEGLLITRPGETTAKDLALDGVAWIQQIAGNTAVLWTPPDSGGIGEALLRAAAEFVDARRIPVAQMVVSERDGYSSALHERCGFPRFAELLYLFAEVAQLAPPAETEAASDLEFIPYAGNESGRLMNLLERTYLGTLDCPGLDGVRSMSDVLEGYRAQGRHSPADWCFVVRGGADVGALILAEHPGFGNWELVYMGVVPEARGQQIGERIVRYAQNVVAAHGAERLVLAVDESNAPALRAYRREGFVEWDRRIVYARLQKRA